MIRKLLGGVALILVATSPGAFGTRMLPLTIEELAARAEWVVHARVTGKTCRQDADGRVFTQVELQVLDLWKGQLSSSTLHIVQGGGVLGLQAVTVAGQSEFELGEEVVAYLVRNSRREAVTVGLAQGTFHLRNDPATGLRHVANVFWGGGTPRTGLAPAALPSSADAPLTLEELKRRTREATR